MAQVRNPATQSPKAIEDRDFTQPIILRGGVDQETSKFSAAPGTLLDCLNYTAGPSGYERLAGLRLYDGTYDRPVINSISVAVNDNESTFTGTAFTLGGQATWGTASYGTVLYFERNTTDAPNWTIVDLADISGALPEANDTITDTESGATLALDPTLVHPPTELRDSVHPVTDVPFYSTRADYLAGIAETSYQLSKQTNVVSNTPYNTYHGSVPGWGPINGGWQFNDEVYVARNCYFMRTDTLLRPPVLGELVQVTMDDASTEQATVLGFQHVEGLSSGNIVIIWLGPHSTTANYRALAGNIAALAEWDGTGTFATTATPAASTDPITTSAVWKATVHGWEWVDLGYTVPFVTGTNAPNVTSAPLFQNDLIDSSRATSVISATTAQSVSTFYTGDIAWTNPTNVTSNDATYATCSLAVGERSQALVVSFGSDLISAPDARIIGIEVTVQARKTGAGTPNELQVRLVSLTGDIEDDELVMSDTRAASSFLTGADVDYIFGGSSDMWGLPSLTSGEVNAGDCRLLLQYENNSAGTGVVEIDYVSIKYYYVPNSEYIFFWNPDLAPTGCEGVLHAYQQFGGEFSIDTAYGEMSFSSITNPQYVQPGALMYTEDSASGVLIAEAQGPAVYNFLPGSVAHAAVESKYQTVFANFYENDSSAAIYGATGAGSAFAYSESGLAFIRTPLDIAVDKPRHVAFHDNRLALGFRPGFVALSAVGVPNDFTGITGADPSLWGVGDTLTGLLALPGNVLAVFSESSIRTLEGSGEQSGNMRVISASSGSKEYTAVLVGEPIFVDNQGVSSLSATDKYGDFNLGRLTSKINSWIQARTQDGPVLKNTDNGPVLAVSFRNKNQYRLFFADGYGLALYFNNEGGVEPTFFHYETFSSSASAPAEPSSLKFVPTWADSSVLSSGYERVVMGNADGEVFVIGGSFITSVSDVSADQYMPAWVILNPINIHGAEVLGKTFYVTLQGKYWGYLPLSTWVDTNYDFNKAGDATPDAETAAGSLTDAPEGFRFRPFILRPYVATLTDGLVVKMGTNFGASYQQAASGGLDPMPPHILQSVILRMSNKGSNRTRAAIEY